MRLEDPLGIMHIPAVLARSIVAGAPDCARCLPRTSVKILLRSPGLSLPRLAQKFLRFQAKQLVGQFHRPCDC